MDALATYLVTQIINSIASGDIIKGAAFVAVFAMLFLQLRKLTAAFDGFKEVIVKALAAGETRFHNIEEKQNDFYLNQLEILERLSSLENPLTQRGNNGTTNRA